MRRPSVDLQHLVPCSAMSASVGGGMSPGRGTFGQQQPKGQTQQQRRQGLEHGPQGSVAPHIGSVLHIGSSRRRLAEGSRCRHQRAEMTTDLRRVACAQTNPRTVFYTG